jgi:hypothetical protein
MHIELYNNMWVRVPLDAELPLHGEGWLDESCPADVFGVERYERETTFDKFEKVWEETTMYYFRVLRKPQAGYPAGIRTRYFLNTSRKCYPLS